MSEFHNGNGKVLEHRLTNLESGQSGIRDDLVKITALLEKAVENGSDDRRQLNTRITQAEERIAHLQRLVYGAVALIAAESVALTFSLVANFTRA